MQKFMVFSLGFLIGVIFCWNARVTVSRQDVFDIKNTLQRNHVDASIARSHMMRALDRLDQCQSLLNQRASDITYAIGQHCQPKDHRVPFNPE